jgi:Cys-rich protein (TIGR01571 family)
MIKPMNTCYMHATMNLKVPPQNGIQSQQPWIGEHWSSGICDCCQHDANYGFCCLASFLPGVAHAILLKDLGIFESCTLPAVCYCGIDLCTSMSIMPLILMSLRMNLSRKLGRTETVCESLCISAFCYPCAIAQLQRDALSREYVFQEPSGLYKKSLAVLGNVDGEPTKYNPVALTLQPQTVDTQRR